MNYLRACCYKLSNLSACKRLAVFQNALDTGGYIVHRSTATLVGHTLASRKGEHVDIIVGDVLLPHFNQEIEGALHVRC